MCRPHAPVGAAEHAQTTTSVAILETSPNSSLGPDFADHHYSDAQPRQSKASHMAASAHGTHALPGEASPSCRIADRNHRLYGHCDAVIPSLEVERHIDQADHRRHFHQRTDHCCERLAGVDPEHRDCHGNRQLKVIARRRKGQRRRFGVVGLELVTHDRTKPGTSAQSRSAGEPRSAPRPVADAGCSHPSARTSPRW